MSHWLLKSEPDTFSIDDLAALPGKTTSWEGVRNYQARNTLRDDMKKGEEAFFYHSSCEIPGIAGIVKVVRAGYPDPSAFDRKSPYYDAESRPDAPRWYTVDVKLKRKLKRLIPLEELKKYAGGALADFVILKRGNRLSVTPVSSAEWEFILRLE
jgi:predicted RNA-binding protein with PUA-like domain